MNPAALFSLEGKVACVTGASSGLGRRTADVLLAAGASVVGVARRRDMLSEWVRQTEGKAAALTGDLSQRDEVERIAAEVTLPFGAPDILVNAAGINTREPADDVSEAGWDSTLELNLSAPFFLAQKLVPAMQERGWGRIVNFASLQTFRAFSGGIAYGASKGGVAQLTRAMAEAWSQHGINCNAIGPGFFRTGLTAPVFADPELERANAAKTCIGRNGELSDIDGPMLFLCSPASDYVTGQVLMVDGGFTAK